MTPSTVTIRICWPATDELLSVRCHVYPGQPARGPDLNGPGEPEDPPEVEILSVRDEAKRNRPEMVDLLASELMDEVEEGALERFAEDEEYPDYE